MDSQRRLCGVGLNIHPVRTYGPQTGADRWFDPDNGLLVLARHNGVLRAVGNRLVFLDLDTGRLERLRKPESAPHGGNDGYAR